MKLSQIIDKRIDQNEIETDYLWIWEKSIRKTIKRINLPARMIDFSLTSRAYPLFVRHSMAIPGNRIFGINIENLGGPEYPFISDENLNMKAIETPKEPSNRYYFAACFYDNSIFIFKSEFDLIHGANTSRIAKRYIISENRWIVLSICPFTYPFTCTGINQKIIIAAGTNGIWIYDMILDSYSQHFLSKNSYQGREQMLIKIESKIYLVILSNIKEIYCCDDPLSEWSFVSNYTENLPLNEYFPRAYYKGIIYYTIGNSLYEFSLKTFESEKIEINQNLQGIKTDIR